METLTMYNGNDQVMVKELPRIEILGYMNPTAIEHIFKQTELRFTSTAWDNWEAFPTSSNQIVRLLLTYNFKTQYHNNLSNKNVIFLKSDHHIGFQVDSICFDCVAKNHIVTNGLQPGDYLAC